MTKHQPESLNKTQRGQTTQPYFNKFLSLLEDANLIAIHWRGREKLHYLNPVPIYAIHERWIRKFERNRLQTLSELKRKLEDPTK